MTTFKDIHGNTLFEVMEYSNSRKANNYAERYNKTHKNKVVEIDYHNGRIDFIN